MATLPTINITGVKIMRSYDYCHFEIQLGNTGTETLTVEQVDEMRKTAMRLADKAVEQYKIARAEENERLRERSRYNDLRLQVQRILEIPESEREEWHLAKIKALQDYEFYSQYDYEDDFEPWWEDED